MYWNWLDWLIVFVSLYYLFVGWQRGFVVLLSSFISFFASLWLAIRFHGVVGIFIIQKFGLPAIWKDVAGYMVVALLGEFILSSLLTVVLTRLPKKVMTSVYNKWLGVVLSFVNALFLISFILLVITSLPIVGTIKSDITQSFLGEKLIKIANRFGGDAAIRFFTIEPTSTEKVALRIPQKFSGYTIDTFSQNNMLDLVNDERILRGLTALRLDSSMQKIAQEKSQDMFLRNYFSHYDPEGRNAADHMNGAHIAFEIVGENLAYAPDVITAHDGLMDSQGHRENILEPKFSRIGIGVIDGGIYGKMFTQVFAD